LRRVRFERRIMSLTGHRAYRAKPAASLLIADLVRACQPS
jgi:hypothetical protein